MKTITISAAPERCKPHSPVGGESACGVLEGLAGRRDVRLAGGSVPCLSWVGLWAGGGVIGEPTFFFSPLSPAACA